VDRVDEVEDGAVKFVVGGGVDVMSGTGRLPRCSVIGAADFGRSGERADRDDGTGDGAVNLISDGVGKSGTGRRPRCSLIDVVDVGRTGERSLGKSAT